MYINAYLYLFFIEMNLPMQMVILTLYEQNFKDYLLKIINK